MSGEFSLWWVDAVSQMRCVCMEWGKSVARLWWVVTVQRVGCVVSEQTNMDDRKCGSLAECAMTTGWPRKSVKISKLFLNDGNIFFYENIRKSFPVNHSSSQEKICLICSVKHVKLFQSESYLWTVVFESQSFQVPFCGNEWCCSHESGTLLVTDPSTVI